MRITPISSQGFNGHMLAKNIFTDEFDSIKVSDISLILPTTDSSNKNCTLIKYKEECPKVGYTKSQGEIKVYTDLNTVLNVYNTLNKSENDMLQIGVC